MPHIDLPEGLPGILGPMAFRPETGNVLSQLAEVLLRGDNSLSPGERELIASYVSSRNECSYCCDSHSTFAALQLDNGWTVVTAVKEDPASAPVSYKMRALLLIAGQVQQSGRSVTDEAVANAKAEGASDVEIHDTVLIAAAFCMFNRYVDGLATVPAPNQDAYDMAGGMIVEHGYLAGSEASS